MLSYIALGGVNTGGLGGQLPLHFCQEGARDFFKIDQKIDIGRGNSKSSEKWRAWPKKSYLCPHFCSPDHVPGSATLLGSRLRRSDVLKGV